MKTILKEKELKAINGGCLSYSGTRNPISFFFEAVKNGVCIGYVHTRVILGIK